MSSPQTHPYTSIQQFNDPRIGSPIKHATDSRVGEGIDSRLRGNDMEGGESTPQLANSPTGQLHELTHFIFNTPNEKSRPGYLKMGWVDAGRLPVYFRPVAGIKNWKKIASLPSIHPDHRVEKVLEGLEDDINAVS
ncbi:MAG: hypothetical protein OEW75_04520, partial [Cyclobacteriaceae bacterium]|nr:hypothetical protein [Cyclobacteriaceae bacterium]